MKVGLSVDKFFISVDASDHIISGVKLCSEHRLCLIPLHSGMKQSTIKFFAYEHT